VWGVVGKDRGVSGEVRKPQGRSLDMCHRCTLPAAIKFVTYGTYGAGGHVLIAILRGNGPSGTRETK